MTAPPPDMPNVPEVPPLDRDVYCPRCDYNLRGLTKPRCPECGLVFHADDFAAGDLRENIPTRLDRCWPTLPHRVLLLSLREMLSGAVRPGRRFRTLDVRGPLAPAVWMSVCGILWVYLLGDVLVAVAIWWHYPISPAAAVRWATMWSVHQVMPIVLLMSLGVAYLVSFEQMLAKPRERVHRVLRILLYATPVLTLPMTAVAGFALIALGDHVTRAMLYVLALMPLSLSVPGRRRRHRPKRARNDVR
ncbi:MAG: hypothetical protein JXO22_13710, partial [Phycisphaerae bacterium]|nr:hypothetical protein [Phycisphaerae bacterium]